MPEPAANQPRPAHRQHRGFALRCAVPVAVCYIATSRITPATVALGATGIGPIVAAQGSLSTLQRHLLRSSGRGPLRGQECAFGRPRLDGSIATIPAVRVKTTGRLKSTPAQRAPCSRFTAGGIQASVENLGFGQAGRRSSALAGLWPGDYDAAGSVTRSIF
jgi:hypothetical protein